MDAQLFIRTWIRDIDWLRMCMQSVNRFWKSPYPTVIVADSNCAPLMSDVGRCPAYRVFYRDRKEVKGQGLHNTGRRHSIELGMNADQFCTADVILCSDSDCLFTRECSADDFCEAENIIIHGKLNFCDPVNQLCYDWYKRATKECLGIESEYECLIHPPFMFRRETFTNCRKAIEAHCGDNLHNVMERYAPGWFSEWSTLGSFALARESGYVVHPPKPKDERILAEFHSWSETPASKREEIQKILPWLY